MESEEVMTPFSNPTLVGSKVEPEIGLRGEISKARFFALMIDTFFGVSLMIGLVSILGNVSDAMKGLLFFGFHLTYHIVMEALWGKTLGKMICGLSVVRMDGSPIGWRESIIRGLFRLIDVNPFLGYWPGALSMIITARNQRIGDIFAKTVVV